MAGPLDRESLGLTLLALLVIVFLAGGAWFLYHPPAPAVDSVTERTATPDTTAAPKGPREISYTGRDGATVLELLKERHQVKLDSELALFGAIVLKIDAVEAGPDEFWIFYRDTLRGDRSPDECTTYTGESIRWVLLERR